MLKISLLVLRCQDIEASKSFYELLGMTFTKEKHGGGPTHYSAEHAGFVFELYPNKEEPPKDNNRLGFNVPDIAKVLSSLKVIESYEFDGVKVYVVKDPDGRKVEISE